MKSIAHNERLHNRHFVVNNMVNCRRGIGPFIHVQYGLINLLINLVLYFVYIFLSTKFVIYFDRKHFFYQCTFILTSNNLFGCI